MVVAAAPRSRSAPHPHLHAGAPAEHERRSSGASERLPGGPVLSRSPPRSGWRGAGRCSGTGEHLSADVAHAHPPARARAVFPPRPGEGLASSPPFLPSFPLPVFLSIDEAIRVASERAPGGPALPRSPSRGSRGGVRCSGTGGLLSGSLPAVGEVRRPPGPRAGSSVRSLGAGARARPTESSRVTAERPREPQAYRVR